MEDNICVQVVYLKQANGIPHSKLEFFIASRMIKLDAELLSTLFAVVL